MATDSQSLFNTVLEKSPAGPWMYWWNKASRRLLHTHVYLFVLTATFIKSRSKQQQNSTILMQLLMPTVLHLLLGFLHASSRCSYSPRLRGWEKPSKGTSCVWLSPFWVEEYEDRRMDTTSTSEIAELFGWILLEDFVWSVYLSMPFYSFLPGTCSRVERERISATGTFYNYGSKFQDDHWP